MSESTSSIERVDINIKKGLVIIVGEEKTVKEKVSNNGKKKHFIKWGSDYQRKTYYYTDGIVIYDSFCLCNAIPYLLQDNFGQRSKDEGNVTDVYICGHGKSTAPEISKLSMKQIAKYLVDNYSSVLNTNIHIMACYAKKQNMVTELKKELVIINEKYADINIDAFSRGTTLVAEYKNSICAMDIKSGQGFYRDQKRLEKGLNCKEVELDLSNYQTKLRYIYNKKKEGKAEWKIGRL